MDTSLAAVAFAKNVRKGNPSAVGGNKAMQFFYVAAFVGTWVFRSGSNKALTPTRESISPIIQKRTGQKRGQVV